MCQFWVKTFSWFSLIFIKGDIVIFKELLTNEQITSSEIRLIGANGEQFGIISRTEALKKAQEANLDLVMMSGGNPAVCKILDYGKYKFDAIKREKELKKNQKTSELKEIQLSMTIDKRDLVVVNKHLLHVQKMLLKLLPKCYQVLEHPTKNQK